MHSKRCFTSLESSPIRNLLSLKLFKSDIKVSTYSRRVARTSLVVFTELSLKELRPY